MQAYSAVVAEVAGRTIGWLESERGQTLIEYALALMLLAMAIVATLGFVGDDVNALFTTAESEFP